MTRRKRSRAVRAPLPEPLGAAPKPPVPTAAEFVRAERKIEQRAASLRAVAQAALQRLEDGHAIHGLHLFDTGSERRRHSAYVFFATAADLARSEGDGRRAHITRAIEAELRGMPGGEALEGVAFEFDSDERVQRELNGDYGRRLRQ